ncbi:hypothetical protein AAMO2058_001027700 [Amorphochlora amoebiformis]
MMEGSSREVEVRKRLLEGEGSINGEGRGYPAPASIRRRVPAAKSMLRYFHVEVRCNIVIQGIVSPLRQVVAKHMVQETDPDIQRFKDAVSDVINKRTDEIGIGQTRHFEHKTKCNLTAIKIGIDVKEDEKSSSNDEIGDETEAKPRSMILVVCVASRPQFISSEGFEKDLKKIVQDSAPFSTLSLMELGFLSQNTSTQASLAAGFDVLVQRYGLDRIGETRRQVAEVKSQMQRNIQDVLERGELLEDVAEKSNEMAETAVRFHKTATKIKRRNRCRHWKAWICGIFCCALVVTIVVVPIVVMSDKIKVH